MNNKKTRTINNDLETIQNVLFYHGEIEALEHNITANGNKNHTDTKSMLLPAEEFEVPLLQTMHASPPVQKDHSNLALLQLFQMDES